MPKCAVVSCRNNSRNVRKTDGVSYFSFPRNPIRCSEWAVIIAKARNEINYKPCKGSVVCSSHFPASAMYLTTKGFCRINKKAKPILNLFKNQTQANPDVDNIQQTNEQKEVIEMSSDNDDEIENIEEICQPIVCLQEENSREIMSPSPSLSVGSNLDTPRETVMKRKLITFETMIQSKNRQINKLQKQNKRLIKKNKTLKNTLNMLKKKGMKALCEL